MLISYCHFDKPSAGLPEANGPMLGPPEAHEPPKVHGPRSHCPPLLEALKTNISKQGLRVDYY